MEPVKSSENETELDPTIWLDKYGNYLYAYAISRVREAALAEDLVQETLLSAIKSVESFKGESSEITWLVGILRHKIFDHFRNMSKQTNLDIETKDLANCDEFFNESGEWVGRWKEDDAPMKWDASPDELLQDTEFCETLRDCLRDLPSRIANTFVLREIHGFSSEEIREQLSITKSNYWVMMHRARLHLRHCLEMNWFRNGDR